MPNFPVVTAVLRKDKTTTLHASSVVRTPLLFEDLILNVSTDNRILVSTDDMILVSNEE